MDMLLRQAHWRRRLGLSTGSSLSDAALQVSHQHCRRRTSSRILLSGDARHETADHDGPRSCRAIRSSSPRRDGRQRRRAAPIPSASKPAARTATARPRNGSPSSRTSGRLAAAQMGLGSTRAHCEMTTTANAWSLQKCGVKVRLQADQTDDDQHRGPRSRMTTKPSGPVRSLGAVLLSAAMSGQTPAGRTHRLEATHRRSPTVTTMRRATGAADRPGDIVDVDTC